MVGFKVDLSFLYGLIPTIIGCVYGYGVLNQKVRAIESNMRLQGEQDKILTDLRIVVASLTSEVRFLREEISLLREVKKQQ